MDSLPRRNTDPLWLQDQDLLTGHDITTTNATATFIKRHNVIYLVTCAHVVDALDQMHDIPMPSLALHSDDLVICIDRSTVLRLDEKVHLPDVLGAEAFVDIAVASLAEADWNTLVKEKFKLAIDLDNWREPDWDKVSFGVAAGYPNEHKHLTYIANETKVGNHRIDAIAEFVDDVEGMHVIHSELQEPHGFFFSGMSGGALYAVEGDFSETVEDDALRFVGIICQGGPRSREEPGPVPLDQILIAAIPVTPTIFDGWLSRAPA